VLLDLVTTAEPCEATWLAGLRHRSKQGGCTDIIALFDSVGNQIPHARLGENEYPAIWLPAPLR